MTTSKMSCNQHTSHNIPNSPGNWKALYRAAILETDKNTIQQRVSDAESAVLARGRELFYNGGTHEEQELLEDALYALRAYRAAWEHAEAA